MKFEVLLLSSGVFHPSLPARAALWRALSPVMEISLRKVSSVEAFPEALHARVRAVVIFIHQQEIGEAALAALEAFVRGGGGLLGVHSATASFKQQPRYFRLQGGRFTGHDPVQTYTASPVSGQVGPFDGLPAFTVRDELYLHEFAPGVQVHFSAPAGAVQAPVVWTYRPGQGRVCYLSPGHLAASLGNPTVLNILQRGLRWASGIDAAGGATGAAG